MSVAQLFSVDQQLQAVEQVLSYTASLPLEKPHCEEDCVCVFVYIRTYISVSVCSCSCECSAAVASLSQQDIQCRHSLSKAAAAVQILMSLPHLDPPRTQTIF